MRANFDDDASVFGAATGSGASESVGSLDPELMIYSGSASEFLGAAPGYVSTDETAMLQPFNGPQTDVSASDWGFSQLSNASGDSPLDEASFASRTDIHTGHVSADSPGWAAYDFAGAGMSDVLWQDKVYTGEVDVWATTTPTPESTYTYTPQEVGVVPLSDTNPAWYLGAVGDLNGDGKSDMLWVNAATGEVDIWNSNPGTSVSFTPELFTTVPNTWVLMGSADFNGDGASDLVWRFEPGSQFSNPDPSNPQVGEVDVWLFNGASPESFTPVNLGVINSNWYILGLGDFNGDGRSDILWLNNFSYEVDIWSSTGVGNTLSFNEQGLGTVPSEWAWSARVADFEGNGRDDVLWQNNQTGELDLWSFTGASTLSVTTQVIGQVPLNWNIVAIGDFNGDGKADILWENENATGTGGFPPHELDLWLSTPGPGVSFTYHELGLMPWNWHNITAGYDYWY
jgi:hypothetical protein